MAEAIDLSRPLRVHIVGIGGAGMSAIATVLTGMGHTVAGSDLKTSRAVEQLTAAGIPVAVGHAEDNLGDVDVVTMSSAVPVSNPEVVAAVERGLPVLRRAEMLAAICATRRTCAVAGTHGKTTTSSMLALVMLEAGLRPSFIIGGEVNEIGTGAVWDEGEWFVVEADESDGTFLELGAEAALVTSVEADHLDRYGDLAAVVDAFRTFLGGARGPRVVCADDPEAAALGRSCGATLYGTDPSADYRMEDVTLSRAATSFTVVAPGGDRCPIELPVPGLHNARNACAALTMAHLLGAPLDAAARALARYGGVARRFQFRGERDGITFVDDYAHNPGKVRAVLAAAKAGEWGRVVCVFQPHLYSRTADLAAEFGDAFVDADLVVVTDIYGAREAPVPGVTGKLVVDAVLDRHPRQQVAYLPGRADVAAYLQRNLRPGDLCLTLGAGDLTSLPDELLGRAG